MLNIVCSLLIGIATLAYATGCTCNPPATDRTGTTDDPYVEGPLTPKVTGNRAFLETGNAVLAALDDGDRDLAFTRMAPGAIRRDKFDGMLDFIEAAHGSIVDFRPMQWWFIDDGTQLMLVKLMVFDRGCGAARMMFDKDDPTRVVGMWMGGNTCSANAEAARERTTTPEANDREN